MKGPLFLTQYKSKEQICVLSKVVETLTPYQVDGVRFLYQKCILKNQNVILNNETGMNEQRQICAFLSAIKRHKPSVIVCQGGCLKKWYYEFSQAELKIVTADELIKDDSWEDNLPDAVILTHEQLKNLKSLPIDDWFFYIIENLECLEKSRYIKSVNSEFRIGLLDQSYGCLSPEMQYFALKWANVNIGDKAKFIESVTFKNDNLLWPFPDFWRRITWKTINKFKPTEEKSKEYERTIKIWCKENKPSLLSILSVKTKAQPTRKRVAKKNNDASKKRKVVPQQTNYEISSESEETEELVSRIRTCRAIKSSSDSDSATPDFEVRTVNNNKLLNSNILDSILNISKTTSEIKNEVVKIVEIENEKIQLSSDSGSATPDFEIRTGNNNKLLNSSILDSLLTTSKINEINVKEKIVETEYENEKLVGNFILDSLIDSQEPSTSKTSKTKFRISEDENESCPILDLLF